MAMSKQDYITMGEQQYARNEARPIGNSWQSKAMQQGFDCAQTDAHDFKLDQAKQEGTDKASDQASEAGQKESEGGSSLKALEALPASYQFDSILEMQNDSVIKFDNPNARERIRGYLKNLERADSGYNAIVSHIKFLREEALKETTDNLRAMRLYDKANKLQYKHQYLIG